MSYLVSDFLINPVLRQARRFSRTSVTNDQVDLVTNHRSTPVLDNASHEIAIDEVAESVGRWALSEYVGNGGEARTSGEPLVASPTEELGGQNREVAPGATEPTDGISEAAFQNTSLPRLASHRLDALLAVDEEDVSENTSSISTERSQRGTPTSASFNSITHATPTSPAGGLSRRSTLDGLHSRNSIRGNRPRNTSIPEDDGNTALRQKIIGIQRMEISAEEKARFMHQLLSEGYANSQVAHSKSGPKENLQVGIINQERPLTPTSLRSFAFWPSSDTTLGPSPSPLDNRFQLSAGDVKPTFAPLKPPAVANEGFEWNEGNEETNTVQSLGCRHYKRNVKLQCSTCNKWYTCRLCHDEVEDHILIRKETKNMLCMLCGYAQRAGEVCVECGIRAAWYYCGICKLWDDDASKSIYHCNDCGICRVGRGLGKDFFHCKTCGVCMAISMEQAHKCIERSTDCDCPICGEYMFTSPQTVVFMRCSHTIHRSCYYAHLKSSYKCPICSQSIVNMETQFRNLDRAIESQPMPPQFQDTRAMVSCNDCRAKSSVKYHWLGLKCAVCDSYNTAQLQIIREHENTVPTGEVIEAVDDPPVEAEMGEGHGTEGRGEIFHTRGPSRGRRHSSYIQHNGSPTNRVPPFSPYSVPQRLGRSVSPLRGTGLLDDLIIIEDSADYAMSEDEDEDGADFWGSRLTSRRMVIDVGEEEEGESESDDDSASAVDEGDDGDEAYGMELFGHR